MGHIEVVNLIIAFVKWFTTLIADVNKYIAMLWSVVHEHISINLEQLFENNNFSQSFFCFCNSTMTEVKRNTFT